MTERTQLEKYLLNEPLDDMLASIQRGEEGEETEPDTPVAVRQSDDLDDDDREHLRHLSFDPGWAVLMRLFDKSLQREEEAVKRLSMEDPLNNKEAIVSGWAYLSAMRRTRVRLANILSDEVKKLESRTK